MEELFYLSMKFIWFLVLEKPKVKLLTKENFISFRIEHSCSGAMDAANLLKPMLGKDENDVCFVKRSTICLARGELRCIGATTLDEYRKYIEKDPAFERRFQQVMVKEPSVADCVSILRGLKDRYESHFGGEITKHSFPFFSDNVFVFIF